MAGAMNRCGLSAACRQCVSADRCGSLPAGELGPQRGECLVAGQRATGGLGGGRVTAGVVAAGCSLGVGLLGRRDLLAVRLEAGLGLGVLPLPGLTGLVVA